MNNKEIFDLVVISIKKELNNNMNIIERVKLNKDIDNVILANKEKIMSIINQTIEKREKYNCDIAQEIDKLKNDLVKAKEEFEQYQEKCNCSKNISLNDIPLFVTFEDFLKTHHNDFYEKHVKSTNIYNIWNRKFRILNFWKTNTKWNMFNDKSISPIALKYLHEWQEFITNLLVKVEQLCEQSPCQIPYIGNSIHGNKIIDYTKKSPNLDPSYRWPNNITNNMDKYLLDGISIYYNSINILLKKHFYICYWTYKNLFDKIGSTEKTIDKTQLSIFTDNKIFEEIYSSIIRNIFPFNIITQLNRKRFAENVLIDKRPIKIAKKK